jgi:protoheme IX farnesyltransferase
LVCASPLTFGIIGILAARLFFAQGVAMKKAGRSLFTYSLAYLFVIFLAFVGDHSLRLMGII